MSQGMASSAKPTYTTGSNSQALSLRGELRTLDVPTSFLAITKSDSTTYSPPLTWLYVGGAGDVAVLGVEDTTAVTIVAPPVGTVLRGAFQKVMSTNTSATNLVGGR